MIVALRRRAEAEKCACPLAEGDSPRERLRNEKGTFTGESAMPFQEKTAMKARLFLVLVLAFGLIALRSIRAAEAPARPSATASTAKAGETDNRRPTTYSSAGCAAGSKDKAASQDKATEFLRLTRDAQSALVAMEAAIVTYVPRGGASKSPSVDLVSAVHIGEKSYYDALNKLFAGYDVVLYELVAPEGAAVPREGQSRSDHPITAIQRFLTDRLDLKFQLSAIDYTRPNFLHADLSPQQFSAAMEKRGESFFTMFLRLWAASMAKQGQSDPSIDILIAFFSKDRSLRWKRIMAETFEELGGSMTVLEGPNGSALVTDRNKRALEVLRKQISAGKKKIAIFYGAAHMPDFERHLRANFGLVPAKVRWLVAWDLQGAAKQTPSAGAMRNHPSL